MNSLFRRFAAALVTTTLVLLVACDLWIGGVHAWWDRHSLTSSIVSNLLVLAVAALIVDEVVADRRRRDRAVSVAVQGLIVYGQSRRTYDEVIAAGVGNPLSSGAPEELRTLASMLLTASPSLFDDPVARLFLTQVNQFAASMFRMITSSPNGLSANERALLESEMSRLRATVKPLLARIPPNDRSALEGTPEV